MKPHKLVSALKPHFKSAVLATNSDEQKQGFAGFLSANIPKDLITHEMKKAGHTALILTGKEVGSYYKSFDMLRRAPELEYLTDKELKDYLWRLECEVFVNRQEYKKDLSKLNEKLEEFVSKLIKPLTEHDVMFVIENFKIGEAEINLGDCTLRHFTHDDLLGWGFAQHKMWQGSIKEYADKTLLIVKEVGNNPDLIAERARKKADLRLHTLRIAFAERSFTPDKQLRFRLSDEFVVREAENTRLRRGLSASPKLWDFEYHEEHDKKYVGYAVGVLGGSTNFPKDLKERVDRALHWLGRAVDQDEFDQKVTHLCTAMESLLSNKSEQRKGERIAYRMVLLESLTGNAFVHPAELLWIYQLRSSVVHGSSVEVATKQEYRTMLHAARCTLKNYVVFIADNGLTKYAELIRRIEFSDEAKQLSGWLNLHFDGDDDIAQIKQALDDAIRGGNPEFAPLPPGKQEDRNDRNCGC